MKTRIDADLCDQKVVDDVASVRRESRAQGVILLCAAGVVLTAGTMIILILVVINR